MPEASGVQGARELWIWAPERNVLRSPGGGWQELVGKREEGGDRAWEPLYTGAVMGT